MDVNTFLRGRPCLDELEGFIFGLKWQGVKMTDELLGPILLYRERLENGRETPVPSKIDRNWTYRHKKHPVKVRKTL